MMRVLLLSGELSLRGSTLYTVSLARELKLRGHRIGVLGPGGLFEGVLDNHRIPLLRAPVHGSAWRNCLYLNTWTRLVREFEPHVLHVQSQDLAFEVLECTDGGQLDALFLREMREHPKAIEELGNAQGSIILFRCSQKL